MGVRNGGRRPIRRAWLIAALALIVSTLPVDLPGTFLPAAEAGPAPIETYLVPLPEEDIRAGSVALYSGTGNIVHTVISVTGAVDGTIVYYDHWEDGFELDLANPVQGTSEVWGDGIAANGAPPGCVLDGCDTFDSGDNAALINDINANPRNPADVFYDGGDRIGATRPVAVTRAGWPADPGTLLAGAVEVYPTDAWGTSYEVPMGVDSPLGDNFEYTAASIMAASGSTTVNVDVDGDGSDDQTHVLAAGESVLVPGLSEGATITSNRVIQVDMLTGDVGATYEGRWFALFPRADWTTSYFNPVGTVDGAHPATVALYNPTGGALTVTVNFQGGSTTVNVPAGSSTAYQMPASGARFSAPSAFYATVLVDYDLTTHDWGFTLIPEAALSTAAVVGWGPGSDNPSAENSSPVWVTAEAATSLLVDYDGDPTTGPLTDINGGKYDVLVAVAAFEMVRLTDTSDDDQTGLRIYTLDGTRIAAAYGQDPSTASTGSPALDLGTAVVPLVLIAMAKVGSLEGDTNGNGALDAGEFIRYTVTIRNDGTANIDPSIFSDVLDPNTTYVAGTTTVDGGGLLDAGATPFPFDEGGHDLGPIAPGQTVIITYDVQLNDPLPPGTSTIINNATLNSIGISIEGTSILPVFEPSLAVTKTSDVAPTGAVVGQTITYTVLVENTSGSLQDGFTVSDVVPVGTSYVAESTSVTGPVRVVSTYADDMESGGYGGSSGSLAWDPDWTEINESDGPGSGDERVVSNSGSLRLVVRDNDGGGEGVSRAVNLAGFDSATISFEYARSGFDGAGDYVVLEATDGVGGWVELQRWQGPGSDPVFLPALESLDAFRTAGAAIRFVTSPNLGSFDQFFIDNVVIAGTTLGSETRTNQASDPTPLVDGVAPNLVTPSDPFTLDPGQTFTVTFQAQVDNPLPGGITELTNTAFVASQQQPTFVTDSVTDPIAFPDISLVKVLLANADEDASGDVSLNDTLTYQFVATNVGATDLTAVTITDPLPGLSSLSCAPAQPAALTIGETLTCTATYLVTQADVNAGQINNTATTEATAPGGATVTDTADLSVPLNRLPNITIGKSLQTGLAGIGAGDTLDYDFVVTNAGNVDLVNIVVTDPLIGGAVSCPRTALALGESMTCTDTYTVTQADVDAGQIANTATVVADDPDGAPVTDTDAELAILESNPSIHLTKALLSNADEDGSGGVSLNDTLTYQFVATNDGNVTLNNVAAVDPLPGMSALACTPAAGASLAPTASMTCTATYSVTQADVDAGAIDNTASASGTSATGADVSDTAAESVSTAQNPSITLSKSFLANADEDASGDVSLSDTITYQFSIVNDGNVTLTVVTLTDPLPGLSAFACGPDILPATLAPAATVLCTATYVVIQADVDAGRLDNTATVSGLKPDGNPISDDDSETVLPDRNPSIDLAKTLQANADEDGSGDLSLGDTLTYRFVATNDGDTGLDNVVATDPLPGLSSLTCVPAAGSSLAPTESMTCTATYAISQADVDAGEIENIATVVGDDAGGGGQVSDLDSATLSVPQNPSITLTKSLLSNADEDASGDVSLNDTLTYEFVVANTGDVTLSNGALNDPLTGGPVSCPQSSLAPAASMTCTANYSVTQPDIDAGSIDNTATVTADGPGGSPVGDSDDESVVPSQNPSITLVKSLLSNADEDASGDVSVGDTLNYRFVATNDGDVTLDLVAVTDPRPGLSALVCAPVAGSSLTPTGSMTCTATYSVTQVDVDAGFVNNTATVTSEHPSGDPGDPSDDVSDIDNHSITIPSEPAIQVTKSLAGNADEDASGDVSLGDTLSYEFLVENTGTVTLNSLDLADPLVGLVTCPVTTLAPAATTTCTADHVVTSVDADAGFIVNTVVATGTDPHGTDVTDDDSISTPVAQNPSITLTKSFLANADEDASGGVSLNDTVTYQFVATNAGDVTLTGARITDPLPGLSAMSCTPAQPATLAMGDTITCNATYSVTQVNVDQGQILNTARAEGFAPDASLVSDLDDETVLTDQTASIVLTKLLFSNADEDASGGVTLNDTLTYRFVATNTGSVTLAGVVVTDPLPGMSGLACVPGAGSVLAPTASMTCTATYVVTQPDIDAGSIVNTATVNATDPGGNPVGDTDVETVAPASAASVALVKSLLSNADEDATGDVSLGDTLTYQFVATNDGSVTIDAVTIADPMAGLSALTCAPVEGSSLAPAAAMTCTATYSVTQTDVDAGSIDNTATVDATDPGGDGIEDTDSESVPVAQTPSVALVKSLLSNADEDASGDITSGDTLTYRFIATNDGDVTLDAVTIADPLPGLGALSCAPVAGSSLAPGGSMTCTATYSVTQADVDAGTVVNTATVDATDPGGNPVSDTDGNTANVSQTPSIVLVKLLLSNADEDASGDVSLADTLTYQFVATNDGTVTLDAVTVSDPLAGLSALSCAPVAGSTLAPTASMTCTATYSVSQADVDAGSIDNTATVDATDPGGNPVSDTDAESAPAPQSPSIVLVKLLLSNGDEDASGDVSLTDTLTYQFVATNNGDVTLDAVTISDPLAGLSVLSCVPLAGSSLAPAASMTCTATFSVTQADVDAGSIDNTATVDATDPGGNPLSDTDDETVPVAQNPSVVLVKSLLSNADEDASGDVSLADTLTYQFVATNDGDVTLDGVTVTDPLPGLSALSCAPVAGSSLAPGGSMTCTATYSVAQPDADNATIDNTATVDATDPGGNPLSDTDDEIVPVAQNPSVALVKSLLANADEDASGDITLGDTLTYRFIAMNDGDVTLDGVTVSDPLLGLSVLSCVPAAGASLAPGESMTCTATYSVTQVDVDAGTIVNTATVGATDPGGNPVSGTDGNTANVAQTPSITLVKGLLSNADEDASGDVSLADTLTYQFVATNDGTVTLSGVAVTDPLSGLGALSCAPGAGSSLAPGESMTCSASYSVTQADVDNASLDNTATVDATDPGGNPVSDTDFESVPITQSPSVALVKSLLSNADEDASGDVSLADTLTYQFVATNDGDVTLDGVTITDPLPGLSGLSCVPVAGSSLVPAASMTCTATYSVTQTDVDNGSVDNTATVDATDPGGNPLSDTDDESVVTGIDPSVALVKSLLSNADEDVSGDVSLGDTLTYEFVATNDGTVTLDGVTITDPLPGLSVLTCVPVVASSLAPAEDMTCTATYSVSQSDVDAGTIFNTATVDATDPGGNPLTDTDDETVTVAQVSSIDLVKSLLANIDEDVSGDVSVGDTLIYMFVATNGGTVTLDGVAITDPLTGLSVLTCAPVAGSTLAPTQAITCTATYTVTQADVDAGSIDNTATVVATDPGGNPVTDTDDETVAAAQNPVIGLAKAVALVLNNGDGTYDVTFDLTIENLGDVTLDDLVMTDDIAGQFAGLTPTGFVAADGSLVASAGWDGSAASNIVAAGQSLAVGAAGDVSVTFTVTPGAVTSVDNNADVTATPPGGGSVADTSTSGINPDPNDDEVPDEDDPTPVSFLEAPIIGVAKSIVAGPTSNGDGSFDVTYEIIIANLGDTGLLNLQATDDTAATYAAADGFIVLSVSSGDFSTNGAYDGSADIDLLAGTDTLALGASGAIQVVVEVTPGDVLGPYENTAVGSATSPGGTVVTDDSQDGVDVDPDGNGNPGDNDDPTPLTFPAFEFDLTITKTGPAEVNDGDTALWTLLVTNLGPALAPAPIVVTDVLPTGLEYVAASGPDWVCGAVGQTVTCTRATDLALAAGAAFTISTVARGEEGDEILNAATVESQGLLAETIVTNNDDAATLVIGVLPATGRNLGAFAWFGLLLLLAGGSIIWMGRRRADRLWIEQGIRI